MVTGLAYDACRVGGCWIFIFGYVVHAHISFDHRYFAYPLLLFVTGLFYVKKLETTQSASSEFVRQREVNEEVKEGYRDLQKEEV